MSQYHTIRSAVSIGVTDLTSATIFKIFDWSLSWSKSLRAQRPRVYHTNFDARAPLRWHWQQPGAMSKTLEGGYRLCFTPRKQKARSSGAVTRCEMEIRG